MSKDLKYGVPKSRVAFLRTVPFLQGVPDKELARLDSHLDEVDVPAGRRLTAEGGGSTEAFIVVSGVAEVTIQGTVVRQTSIGEMIGEVGVLQHSPRTATVVAVTPMRLLVVHISNMSWLFEDAALAKRIEENLARHTGAQS